MVRNFIVSLAHAVTVRMAYDYLLNVIGSSRSSAIRLESVRQDVKREILIQAMPNPCRPTTLFQTCSNIRQGSGFVKKNVPVMREEWERSLLRKRGLDLKWLAAVRRGISRRSTVIESHDTEAQLLEWQ
ncbi:MAG: hypothetical protein JXD19_11440 [Deltaproteobacteria bacterium]|nr:hypothetical protein [Deltaproteobacteria bacterium]